MEIKMVQNDDTMIFTLTGRLDTKSAPELLTSLAVAMESAEKICLDFSKVEYLSSTGLRVLYASEKKSIAKGKTMTLRNVRPEVMEIFIMTGFSDILNIVSEA